MDIQIHATGEDIMESKSNSQPRPWAAGRGAPYSYEGRKEEGNFQIRSGKGLNGTSLKWIAMTAMLIDHIGAVILERLAVYQGDIDRIKMIIALFPGDSLYYAAWGTRVVGRIAFPIYCFLLVEGFLHTRNWKRYWFRLAVFALISEVCFDLAVSNVWFGGTQNVFFELAAGLLVLSALKNAERLPPGPREMSSMIAIAAGCGITWLFKTDYDMEGILLIAAYYLLRSRRWKQALGGGFLAFGGSFPFAYGAAALSSVPILFYNGTKGKGGLKYVFYWFYPAHLLILFLIRRFVIGIPVG